MTVRDATLAELDPITLYRLMQLRSDVFIVEQDCAYPDLDGRDAEPSCRHLWIDDAGGIRATLRLLTDPGDIARIGRVATARDARGQGHAAALMRRALELAGDERDVVLEAQAYLQEWYGRFGFAARGPAYVEDGIPHVPMQLAR